MMEALLNGAHGWALNGGVLVAAPSSSPTVRRTRRLADIAARWNLLNDPTLLGWFVEADRGRLGQNAHDRDHGLAVWQVGGMIANFLRFTDAEKYTTAVVCYSHDVGSRIGQLGHEAEGARMMRQWMLAQGASDREADDVALPIEGHRTSFVLDANGGFFSRPHAALILADKSVGDEERVRLGRRLELDACLTDRDRMTEWLRAEDADWNGPVHDPDRRHARINFGIIPTPHLKIDRGTRVMSLTLKLKRQIVSDGDILGLFGDRYRACHMAAGFLDYHFRLHLDDNWYGFNEVMGQWQLVDDVEVPMVS
jgi:hypothetical protein